MGGCSPFMIEADEVKRMCEVLGLSEIEYLATLVKPTQKLAKPVISQFHVGAVGLGASGRIFMGVNLEFEGLPLHNSVHAEQFLVANAAQNGERQLKFIVVSAAPCGLCRQFLQETYCATKIKVLIADANAETQFLSYFLPHRFGPDDLEESTALVFEPHDNHLVFPSGDLGTENGNSGYKINDGISDICGIKNLREVALEAANMSHAPYSKCPSGIALRNSNGQVFKGFYIESAAHNPSLAPLQASLIAFLCGNGCTYDDITDVVLVEKDHAMVKQAETVRLALQKISPHCSFYVFSCYVK